MLLTHILPAALLASGAAAWSRTDHWQTKVITTTSRQLFTSSIAVYPTAAPPVPVSSNVSTTLLTSNAAGAFFASVHTWEVTVTDLFYADDAAGLCVSTGFRQCSPTPTFTASNGITTNYYAPIVIANPSSCTLTSFAYTTAQTVFPPGLFLSLPGAAEQATESVQALFVTTYVSTRSTNLGGQAVTTTVADVYLRDGMVSGLKPGYEFTALSECVDPRKYSCEIILSATPTADCPTTGQTYPPTAIAAGNGGGVGGGAGTGGGSGPSPTSTGAAMMNVPGAAVVGAMAVPAMVGMLY